MEEFKINVVSGDVIMQDIETARLNLKTVSGDIKYDFSLKVISSGRRDLEGTVGDGKDRIMISTVSGDVTVGY